jgi:hypothetical protein
MLVARRPLSGRFLAICTVLAAIAALPVATAAAPVRLTWSGSAREQLGRQFSGATTTVDRRLTLDCDRSNKILDVHTTARGVRGPLGVSVGMTDRALRAALGRKAARFTVAGRPGRLLAGPKGHSLWALAVSRRVLRVGEFGVALTKRVARRPDLLRACLPAATTPSPAPGTDSGTTTPADTGTTTTPAPQCPATLPAVGPYMRVACGDSTGNQVQYTCRPDWQDQNQDPSDGCEAEKDGLQAMWFHTWSAMALQDRVVGTFSMDGYGPDATSTDWGSFSGPDPVAVTVQPDCGSNPTVACPNGQPENPPPTLTLDIRTYPGDDSRSVITPTGTVSSTGLPVAGAVNGYDQANGTARFRLKSASPIPISYAGADCDLSIDSTPGVYPDVELIAPLAKTTDPQSGQGADGPPQLGAVTINRLTTDDYSLSGDFSCQVVVLPASAVVGVVKPALTSWYKSTTRLCAAADPYWWQPCPPSVQVSW